MNDYIVVKFLHHINHSKVRIRAEFALLHSDLWGFMFKTHIDSDIDAKQYGIMKKVIEHFGLKLCVQP